MASSSRARFIAASMVSPSTNWRPISFMARPTAVRITGSPSRLTAARRWPTTPGSRSSSTLPVSIKAQVEAFTRLEADLPRWRPQSEGAILSSISASIVSASGTRSNASAKHISAMPSSVERPYSARKTSISPGLVELRIWRTSSAPPAVIRARAAASRPASAIRACTSVASSRRLPVSITVQAFMAPALMASLHISHRIARKPQALFPIIWHDAAESTLLTKVRHVFRPPEP